MAGHTLSPTQAKHGLTGLTLNLNYQYQNAHNPKSPLVARLAVFTRTQWPVMMMKQDLERSWRPEYCIERKFAED